MTYKNGERHFRGELGDEQKWVRMGRLDRMSIDRAPPCCVWLLWAFPHTKHDGHTIIDILCVYISLFIFRPIRLGSDVIAVAVNDNVELRKKFSLVFKGVEVSFTVSMKWLIHGRLITYLVDHFPTLTPPYPHSLSTPVPGWWYAVRYVTCIDLNRKNTQRRTLLSLSSHRASQKTRLVCTGDRVKGET